MDLSTLKKPSAWIPISMSLAALAVVLGYLAIYGIPPRGGDEGATAHTWQVSDGRSVPVVVYFVLRWLPRDARKAVPVLLLQVVAAVAAPAPVYLLRVRPCVPEQLGAGGLVA